MPNRRIRQIQKEADALAKKLPGVLPLLLTLKEGQIRTVTYDKSTGRFRIRGKIVPLSEIRRQLGIMEAQIAKTMDLYARRLATGVWTIEKWYVEMGKLIESSHTLFAALAVGSIAAATNIPDLVKTIDKELEFLLNFKKEIKRGRYITEDLLNVRPIIARSKSYIRAMFIQYAVLKHQLAILAGFTEAKRILTAQENCRSKPETQGCWEAAGVWMPIKDIPPIGTLTCGQYCKCYLIFRK